MGRVIVIILAFTALLLGTYGLRGEIENLVNLQDNIHEILEGR